MDVVVDAAGVELRLAPEELHVVHAALHQYGEHLITDALAGTHPMSGAFRAMLEGVKVTAGDLAEELDRVCGTSFGHSAQP